jgi:16S rRNA (uracil1498-N3)-methyltransferase
VGLLHSPPRLIVPRIPSPGERIRLSRAEAAHARARRLAGGDPVVLLDGSGAEGRGRLVGLEPGSAEVEVDRVIAAAPSGPDVLLAIAGLRTERLSWIVEKATELGSRRITILRSERTQAFRASGDLVARLTRVAQEAAKQSENARWPRLEGPCDLSELLVRETIGSRIFLDASGDRFPAELAAEGPLALCVGPEGGWADSERQQARRAGWSLCSLPAGKLRAETAAIAALVLARAALARAREP